MGSGPTKGVGIAVPPISYLQTPKYDQFPPSLLLFSRLMKTLGLPFFPSLITLKGLMNTGLLCSYPRLQRPAAKPAVALSLIPEPVLITTHTALVEALVGRLLYPLD